MKLSRLLALALLALAGLNASCSDPPKREARSATEQRESAARAHGDLDREMSRK